MVQDTKVLLLRGNKVILGAGPGSIHYLSPPPWPMFMSLAEVHTPGSARCPQISGKVRGDSPWPVAANLWWNFLVDDTLSATLLRHILFHIHK